jgi:hypothetical protein
MIEERTERPRTDILAADEPQPIEPLQDVDLIVISARMSRPCRCAETVSIL